MDWGAILGIVSVIGIPVAVGLTMAATTPGEFRFIRGCFILAAILACGSALLFNAPDIPLWARVLVTSLVGGLSLGGLVIAFDWVGKKQAAVAPPSKLEKQAQESAFLPEFQIVFFSRLVGATAVGNDEHGRAVTFRNPVILLMRIDNVGARASAVFMPRLIVEMKDSKYVGTRQLITDTLRFPVGNISKENDLYYRGNEAIEPGHSLSAAVWFHFPELPPGTLTTQRENAKYVFSFSDVFGREHSQVVKELDSKETNIRFPGIKYE
jgi:hypothetical protein